MALHGPTIKAANTRQAMPLLKVIADLDLTDIRNLDHVLMHLLIEHVLELNRLNYSTGIFFTQAELAAHAGKYMQALRQRAK